MLFSRIVERLKRLNTAIARTAMGMDADTVRPARSARYTVTAPKMTPKMAPRATALTVNSAGDSEAGTNGLNVPGATAGSTVVGETVVGECAMVADSSMALR